MLSRENVWIHLMSGSRIMKSSYLNQKKDRIAVKADDKNSDDKISVTVFGKNKGGILNGRRS